MIAPERFTHFKFNGRVAPGVLVTLVLLLVLATLAAAGADPVIGPQPPQSEGSSVAALTSPGSPMGTPWSVNYQTRCEDEYRQNPDGSWSVRTVCYCDDECCGELHRGDIVSTGEWRPAAAAAGCCSLLGVGETASPGAASGALRAPAHAYLARGEFVYSFTDLVIPGRGFDYRLVRTYKNQLDGDSPVGHNWDHSYNRNIAIYKADSDGTIASYLLSDGAARGLLFSRASEGVYLSPPRFYMRLTRNSDGSFTVRDREGTQASFRGLDSSPAAGKITALADRNGNTMRFLYDSAGRLATVVDTLGRRIEYLYGPTGRLMEVSDFANRRVLFGYDAAGDLIAVTVVAKGQAPATSGRTTRYTYSTGNADGRANHNLLTITPPGFTAPTLVNAYDNSVGTFTFDRLIRQEYSGGTTVGCCGAGSGGVLTIAYEPLAYTPGHEGEPALEVTVTDDQGVVTEYYYDDTDYLLRRVAHSPAQAAGASAALQETTYTWNELDEVAAIVHPMGDRVEYRYDTWNLDPLAQSNILQARQVPDPGRGGAPQTTSFTYEPQFNRVASQTDAAGHVTAYAHDPSGNRTRETDALGNSTQRAYDAAGVEQSATDPNGHTTTRDDYHLAPPYADFKTTTVPGQGLFDLTFDASLSWDSEDALVGLRWRWDWDDDGLYDTGYTAIPTQTHTFPARGLYAVRLEVIDSDHLTSTVAYRVQAPPRWLYLPVMLKGGRDGSAAVNSQIPASPVPFDQINLAASASITYTLTVTRTDPLGNATVSIYDAYGSLLSLTDPRGHTTCYEYDAFGRLVRITDGLGGVTSYIYDAVGNRTAVIDANGHTWTYEYDGARLVREVDPLGHATAYSYDARGNRTSLTDANGHTTTYAYDAFNRPVVVTDALGGVTRYAYDANGNRTSEMDKNGNTTTYAYDGLDQLIEVTDPLGQKTTYAYNAAGNRVAIGAANGNVIRNTYDALGQLVQMDDNLGRMVSYTYDPAGNRLTQTDGNGNTIRYAYDASNRVVTATDAMNQATRYTYDAASNLILTSDRNGNTTSQAYDALSRRVSITNSLGAATLYVYDPVGNLLRIADANGHTTQYAYDAVNRPISETYADDTIRTFTYDGAGNLLTRTDQNGATTSYQYNATYSLIKRDYPAAPDDAFTYDKAGRMLTAARDGWLVTFAYDGADRVIETTQNGQIVRYAYNTSNNTRTVTYPGGRVITETVDPRGRLLQIGDGGLAPLVEYTYDLGERVLSRADRNGVTTTYSYNANNWITGLAHRRGGSLLAGFAYGYDWEGNRQFAQNTLPFDAVRVHTYSEQYDYDSTYRLVGFKAGQLENGAISVPVTTHTWHLDAVGNWDQFSLNGVGYQNTSNQMNEYDDPSTNGPPPVPDDDGIPDDFKDLVDTINPDGFNSAHDKNGNLVDDGIYRYEYDHENRLVRVTRKADGQVMGEYRYDALGRRVVKTVRLPALKETRFFYDSVRVIEEQDANGATEATYVYGAWVDEVLNMERDGQAVYYHQNALGSVVGLTTSLGDVAERYVYSTYGCVTVIDGDGNPVPPNSWGTPHSVLDNPYLFTGRQLDEETGLYHYRARTYSCERGRFLQRDPLGYVDGMNLYEYAESRPTINRDPSGLACGSGWTEWVVPDQGLVPGTPVYFDFTSACEWHDDCYGQCGVSRASCDSGFRDIMLAWCDGAYGSWYQFVPRAICRSLAYVYYGAVRGLGEGPFCNAQEASRCCPLPPECQ